MAAVAAYFFWGLAPLYFKALHAVPAAEIIAHRVLWSVLLLAGVLALTRQRAGLDLVRRQPRVLLWLSVCSLLVTSNWLVYVWAVNSGRVLESSLGYFINPLVSVLLGAMLLKERLRRWQWGAFALAVLGVLNQVAQVGALPWISLFLAITFAVYGLLRKRLEIDAVSGLFIETTLAAPLALAYLAQLGTTGELAFLHRDLATDVLLVAAGIVTSLPLVLFGYGARRLRLATLGFLQYLAPSLMFALGVTVFGESLDGGRLLTFVLIWAGLAVYSLDAWRASREATR